MSIEDNLVDLNEELNKTRGAMEDIERNLDRVVDAIHFQTAATVRAMVVCHLAVNGDQQDKLVELILEAAKKWNKY